MGCSEFFPRWPGGGSALWRETRAAGLGILAGVLFGASAIGRTPEGYIQNEVPPGVYAQRIATGRLATVKGYRLTAEDRLRAEIIERLMCDFSADIAAIAARHGFDAAPLLQGNAKLAALKDDGAVDISGGRVTVRQDHRFIIRAVAAAFDAYIDQSARTHSKAA